MRRSVTLIAGVFAALALAITAGCSSSVKGSASANQTIAAAGSSATAAAPQTSSAASSSSANTSSSSSVDVCSLMTSAQATALNNVTYSSAASASLASGYNTCTYKNTGSADPVDIQDLTVEVISITGCWNELQSAEGPGKPISDLGDAAFGAEIGIDIKVGSRCVTVHGLTHAELQDNYAPDVAMAKIILAKLG